MLSRSRGVAPTVLLAGILALGCGCATQGENTSPLVEGNGSIEPIACDDLATPDLIADALTSSDGAVPTPRVAAPALTFRLDALLVPAAGGLHCSWGTDAPPVDFQGDWAYFTVAVLSDVELEQGDDLDWDGDLEPLEFDTNVGGVEAAAGCNDIDFAPLRSCVVAASVNGAWVRVQVDSAPFSPEARFAALEPEELLSRVTAAAEYAFTAVGSADRSRLPTPTPTPTRDPAVAAPECEDIGVEPASDPMPSTGGGFSETSVLFDRAQIVRCERIYPEDGVRSDVWVLPGAADPVREVVFGPDFDSAFLEWRKDFGVESVGPIPIGDGGYTVLIVGDNVYVTLEAQRIGDLPRSIVSELG